MTGAVPPWRLAPRDARLAAYFLDSAVAGLFLAPALLFSILCEVLGERGAAGVPAAILAGAGLFAWQLWMWASLARTGQSWGKRRVGVRVVGPTGAAPGWIRGVVLRSYVVPAVSVGADVLLPGAGSGILVLDMLIILLPGRRCLHELLAGTCAIEARDWRPPAP